MKRTFFAVKSPPDYKIQLFTTMIFLQIDFILEFGNGCLNQLHRFAPFRLS